MGGKFEAGSPGGGTMVHPLRSRGGGDRLSTRSARHALGRSDVTMQCRLAADEVRAKFSAAGQPLAAVLDLAEVWFQHAQVITFHDPLAAACVFEPDLCHWKTGTVTVETRSDLVAGLTQFAPGNDDAPHQVAVGVDAQRFFDHYFAITAA